MIGLFLGEQIDQDFVRFVILYGDDPLALLERPIVAVFAVMTLGLVLFQIRDATRERSE